MKFYTNLNEFITAARDNRLRSDAINCLSANAHDAILNRGKSAAVVLPKEGYGAILSGFHLYAMLQLRPGLTTSSVNSDRIKNIELLGLLVQGAREVAHRYDGALLEAQGPVVHIFIPDDGDEPRDVQTAAMELQEVFADGIRAKAGTDFLKGLVGYAHGPSILVNAEDAHGDESIVSLAPAANAPAKVLWKKWEDLGDGAIVEALLDGTYREIGNDEREVVIAKSAGTIFNSSRELSEMVVVAANAEQRAMPVADSPDSPTIEEPHMSFAISFRADMDGFTKKVSTAFDEGEDAVRDLAREFYEIMAHARKFCSSSECIHLPWAGDCFNLLLSFDERKDYQEARQRRIVTVAVDFIRHMGQKFPSLGWAVSVAGGNLESAQVCNTLVSRITVGHTTLLLSTGLPVERSLQGIIRESPNKGRGVIWKGDIAQLESDLQDLMNEAIGGENYRHYKLGDVEDAQDKKDFIAPPAPYKSSAVSAAVAAMAPTVKGHYDDPNVLFQ
ncbi:MAG: hypothetical protein QM627_12295 [Luteolibacter sp.]